MIKPYTPIFTIIEGLASHTIVIQIMLCVLTLFQQIHPYLMVDDKKYINNYPTQIELKKYLLNNFKIMLRTNRSNTNSTQRNLSQ